MPTPTRPGVLPIWTVGNSGARVQPTNGEQFSGFTPNFRPPSGWHNWLFGVMSDWITWLDYITNSPSNFPVSNAGHNVATATTLQGQLDQLDAFASSIGLKNEVPTGTVDGTNGQFQLSEPPVNAGSVVAFQDGLDDEPAEFIVSQISGLWYVIFQSGSIPEPGMTPTVVYMTGSSGVGVGGGVAAIENESGGIGLYFENNVNIALMKSLIAGTNMTITDDGLGHLTLSASGSGGGSAEEVHGQATTPVAIDPTVGVVPTTASRQTWWINPNAGSGQVPITARPAIAAGTVTGQKLVLKSPAVTGATPYLQIPDGSPDGTGSGGAGTDQNGPVAMGPYGQSISYTWDGRAWSEDTRRV